MSGLNQLIPLPFGTLYTIINILLLTFGFIVDRHNIGIATFINLFLLGYITQYSYEFLQTIIINPSYFTRAVCLIVGIVVICFSSSLYMTANLGVSTYDAIAIILSGKWHIAKFKFCRITTALICVIVGIIVFLIGGGSISVIPTFVGIATIITAFFMGPLIEVFNEKISRPLLNK